MSHQVRYACATIAVVGAIVGTADSALAQCTEYNACSGYGTSSWGIYGQSSSGMGVYGIASGGNASATGEWGVYGTSGEQDGIYGEYVGASSYAGVHGQSSDGNGVAGWSTSGVGVYAKSTDGNAVYATSSGSVAVYATSSDGNGVSAISTGGSGNGLYASSNGNTAVYGTSSAGNGVSGYTSVDGKSGIFGENSDTGASSYYSVGVRGVSYSTGGSGVLGNNLGSGYGGYFTTSTGTYSAYFNADISILGTSYGPSDARLKQNIKPIAGAIDQLLKLQGVTFEWKEPEKHSNKTGAQIGFIAQEVEKVFPQWVHTDADGFKEVSVGQVEGLEVEAIRTLKSENDELKARIDRLENGQTKMTGSGFSSGNGSLWGLVGVLVGAGLVSRNKKKADTQA